MTLATAVPFALSALMLVEFVVDRRRGRADHTARDAATSVMAAVPHTLLLTVLPPAWVVALTWARAVRTFTRP